MLASAGCILMAASLAAGRWSLVKTPAAAVIDVAASAPAGVGGFETGSFVKADGQYHAFVHELVTVQPYSHCPALWWDGAGQLGHWTAPHAFGPWTRTGTMRQPVATQNCGGSGSSAGCQIAARPLSTWNSGGALFAPTALNGTEPVWSLFYGSRWAVSTTKGEAGIHGPFVDVACIDANLQRPSYQLANVSRRTVATN